MRTSLIGSLAAVALAAACSAQTEDTDAADTAETVMGAAETAAADAAETVTETVEDTMAEVTPATDAVAVAAPSGSYALDKNHASLIWKIWHVGMSHYAARFDDFDVDLNFNAEDPTQSTLHVVVDPASIDLDYEGDKDFKAELLEDPRFFRVAEFPTIEFNSTSMAITGENTGTVTGDLTFMGVTKPVTLDIRVNAALAEHPFTHRGALGFSATGVIKRSDFGMDFGAPNILSDEVELQIEAEFNQAG